MTREENIRRTLRGYVRTQAVAEIERALRLEQSANKTSDGDLGAALYEMAEEANSNARILLRIGDELQPPLSGGIDPSDET